MPTDAFTALGLRAVFDLTDAQIEGAYLERIAALHPDSSGGSPQGADAAELNRARQILRDPERRADHLLALGGGPSAEQNRSLPDGFLAEMMSLREEIEAGGNDPAPRERWRTWALKERGAYAAKVSGQFAALAGLAGEEAAKARGQIRTTLNAWRYIERLIEQLSPDYDAPAYRPKAVGFP